MSKFNNRSCNKSRFGNHLPETFLGCDTVFLFYLQVKQITHYCTL